MITNKLPIWLEAGKDIHDSRLDQFEKCLPNIPCRIYLKVNYTTPEAMWIGSSRKHLQH